MKTMKVLDSLKQELKNAFFPVGSCKNKNRFGLYEVTVDYFETNNLINNPKYDQI